MDNGSDQVNRSRLFIAVTAAYISWASVFVWRTSTLCEDGTRYFAIFDDGMISMRYAKHIAAGLGGVWNVGERIEGYTNPLWVLVMAAAVKSVGYHWAPLLIQLIGVGFVVASAFMVRRASILFANTCLPATAADIAGFVSGVLIFAYYPVSFWALDGMEASGLTCVMAACLLFTARRVADPTAYALPQVIGAAIVAYFLRPDGFLQILPIVILCLWWAFRTRSWAELRLSSAIATGGAILLAAHLTWRKDYYGLVVPNTYVLKIEGYDLITRIRNGVAFVTPYIYQVVPGAVLALWSCFYVFRNSRLTIACWGAIPIVAVGYQVFVGGDPFLVWRQLTPAYCAIAVLAGCGFAATLRGYRKVLSVRFTRATAVIALLAFVLIINVHFLKQIVGIIPPYNVQRTHDQVRRALAWSRIAKPGATTLLFNAGTLPYFWDGESYDALGKMDSYIAALKPNMSVAWDGMEGVPGHAKFDLDYSLVSKKPDYIEKWVWFSADMSRYVHENYTAVRSPGSGVILCVATASGRIEWNGLVVLGDCSSSGAAAL